MMRLMPIVTGAVAGAIDGVLAENDATNRASDKWYSKYSTWYEALLLVGGMVADQARMLSPSVTDPLMVAGAALLSKTVLEANVKVSTGTAFAIPHYAAPMHSPSFGAVLKQPTMGLV